jgi:TonB family protein
MRRLLLAALLPLLTQAAKVPGPSHFYFVSATFSDAGAEFYYRIVDVSPVGPDTLVRYLRIAPAGSYCPTRLVQAIESRLPATSPAQLAGPINPCAIKPSALQSAIRRYPKADGVLESISFGIVAQCGATQVALALPISQAVDLKKLKRAHPKIARLWDLPARIYNQTWKGSDPLYNPQDPDAAPFQPAGAELVPHLRSGRYDQGLALATASDTGISPQPLTFRKLLEDYTGPVNLKNATPIPELRNAPAYPFVTYAPPRYPPLALQARIQGAVELQLTVDPATGTIAAITTHSGHPLLVPSAAAAAAQWRFQPNSLPNPQVNLTLDYAVRCPIP